MKVIINGSQKGLLFKNGILQDILGAGKYSAGGSKSIEILSVGEEICSKNATVAQILAKTDKSAELISEITVKNGEICLHYIDGVFSDVITAGRHAFWNDAGKHEFKLYSTDEPKISDIPPIILASLGASYVTEINVSAQNKAVVSYNGKTAEYLDEGRYFYWNGAVKVMARIYDMRVQTLSINGQEILTKDKVGIRVNFTANWRIVDYRKLAEEYSAFDTVLYTA